MGDGGVVHPVRGRGAGKLDRLHLEVPDTPILIDRQRRVRPSAAVLRREALR